MELQRRTLKFRDSYRSAMQKNYSGFLHAGFVFGVGITLMLLCFSRIERLSLWELLFIPAAIFLSNIGEYVAHKELGHKKRKFAKLFYSRHTGDHHSFFNHLNYQIDAARDLRVVLFPALLLVAVTVGAAAPMGWIIGRVFSPNAGWLFAGTLLCSYLFYEFIHLCDHLPEHYAITRWPLIKQLREHHRAHHDPDNATQSNFNVTLPITDWMLGTLKKK